jgi:hypothetical protein
MTLADFVDKFDDFSTWSPNKQADFIAYYLLAVQSVDNVTAKTISASAHSIDLKPHTRLPQYLSESANSKQSTYIKAAGGGYRLEHGTLQAIAKKVNNEPTKISVSAQLTDMVAKVGNPVEASFLQEAINCHRVKSHRAAIILVWIVAMYHLQNYIFANKLVEFNTALAKNPEKKMSKVTVFDDFSDIGESKQIELARSAGIISNDVRKILDEKLGVRNSAAHPSGITFSEHKATEFALDLIGNVLLKY